MVINPASLVGLTIDYAKRLGEQAGYEVREYDQRKEEKLAAENKDKKKEVKEEHRSNRLNVCHLDGVVVRARIG